jgi:hypothetical protein
VRGALIVGKLGFYFSKVTGTSASTLRVLASLFTVSNRD